MISKNKYTSAQVSWQKEAPRGTLIRMKWCMEAQQLGFAWEQQEILREVEFTISTGEAAVIFGRSGEGKTTLLKLLAGVLPPTSGVVAMRQGKEGSLKKGAYQSAWMPQEDLLLPWRSILRNSMVAAPVGKYSEAILQEEALALLSELGLFNEAHSLPHELSQGMRQRVALVRTLLMKRPFLLLDEPCSALDQKSRCKVLEMLGERCRNGRFGIVMVSHQEQDAHILQAQGWSLSGGVLCRR